MRRVFISHDSRDAELAVAFANLLINASGGVLNPFSSSDRTATGGIPFGADWYAALTSALDEASDVVALLTERSLHRPWILYEAGFAKGKLGKTVLGVALGVRLEQAVAGPFAQFQNSGDDEGSLIRLVQQLVSRHADAAPREDTVRYHVREFLATVNQPRQPTEPVPVFLQEFPRDSYRHHLVNATNVWLVGVSLRSVLRAHHGRLEQRLNHPDRKLRVLVARPHVSVIKTAVLRTSRDADAGVRRKCAEIEETLKEMRKLRGRAPGQVEIRTTDYPLAYGLHAMDPGEASGVLYLKLYPYRMDEEQKPKLVLRARNDRGPFEQELQVLWEESTPDAV